MGLFISGRERTAGLNRNNNHHHHREKNRGGEKKREETIYHTGIYRLAAIGRTIITIRRERETSRIEY